MKKNLLLSLCLTGFAITCYAESNKKKYLTILEYKCAQIKEPAPEIITSDKIVLEKELLYDNYTLTDTYPYKDTTRQFQWEKIKEMLATLDNMQRSTNIWAVLQNYRNKNGAAVTVRDFKLDNHNRLSDAYGVERYQSVPVFALTDSLEAVRYGRDGSPVKIKDSVGGFFRVETVNFEGEWLIPKRYVKNIGDTIIFAKAVFVDRTNQNITTLEKHEDKWLVRSMNPATTGVHRPPYQRETPLGLFVVQDKKTKMTFLKDGSTEEGGFAPYASRFSNGGYVHGVPVNVPDTNMIEYSRTLGTTPRSHMCVRNATSHAKFIYNWVDMLESLVFVFD